MMMKRTSVIIVTLILILLAGVILLKKQRSQPMSEMDGGGKSVAEKEKIQQFWKYYRLGTRERLAGKMAAAAAAYRNALDLNHHHEGTLYHLGNVYLELGEYAKARASWQRLVKINPHSARAHFQLGNLYMRYDIPEFFNIDSARQEYLRTLEINQEETGPSLRLGQVALIRGNLTGAQQRFEDVIRTNFKSVEALFLNGYIAWKEKKQQNALNLFSLAVKYARIKQPPGKKNAVAGNHTPPRSGTLKNRTIFQRFLTNLSTLDSTTVSREMNQRYQALDAFLKEVREKI